MKNEKETDKTTPKRRRIGILFGGDKGLWTIITALLIISVLVTFSATIYKPGGSAANKLFMQLLFICMGIGALVFVHFIKYQIYGRLAKTIYIIGLLLTLCALFFGEEAYGVRRDLTIPGTGQKFQPFEILKIGLVMILAKELASRQKNIDKIPILPSLWPPDWFKDSRRNYETLMNHSLPIFLPIVIACAVALKSVGNSTTLIIAITCLVLLFVSRVRMADMAKIVGIGCIAAVVAFSIGSRSDTGSSRMARLKSDMWEKHAHMNADSIEIYDYDSRRIYGETAETEQSVSAKMAVASGGFFGKGPGMSTHRSNLAEAESDFAYAFFIEEYGALGGIVVLMLFLWLFFRTILIAKKCATAFPSLLVLGLALMIVLQAMIHMAVSVALFPVTGQQLPLISKGGSSLIFTLIAVGMILGVSRQTVEKTLDTPKDESWLEK